MAQVPSDLVHPVHKKGSLRQILSLETPDCLSCITPPLLYPYPPPPPPLHTRKDTCSSYPGPTHSLLPPLPPCSEFGNARGPTPPPLQSHNCCQTLPKGTNCLNSAVDQLTLLKGRGLQGAPRYNRKARMFGITCRQVP